MSEYTLLQGRNALAYFLKLKSEGQKKVLSNVFEDVSFLWWKLTIWKFVHLSEKSLNSILDFCSPWNKTFFSFVNDAHDK